MYPQNTIIEMEAKHIEQKMFRGEFLDLPFPVILLDDCGAFLSLNDAAEDLLHLLSRADQSVISKRIGKMIKNQPFHDGNAADFFSLKIRIAELNFERIIVIVPVKRYENKKHFWALLLPVVPESLKAEERYIHYLKTINKISSKSYRFKSTGTLTRFITSELFSEEYDFFHVGLFLRENLFTGEDVVLIDVVGESRSLFRNSQQNKYRQSIDTGIIGWVMRNARPVVVNNTDESELYHCTPFFRGKSEICVPILLLNEVIGVINIESKELADFDDSDVSFLKTVADIYADNIYRIHTTGEIQRKNLKLEKYLKEIRKAKESLEIQSEELKISLKKGREARKLIKKQNEIMQNKLKMGVELQKSLLPREFPNIPDIHFNFTYIPNSQLGGDFFDVCQLDKHHLGIIIADVSGYGVSAAMIAAMFKAFFNNYRKLSGSPAEIIGMMNKELYSIINTGDFISAFYMILNLQNYKICYTNAGHPYPLLYRHSLKKVELLDTPGFFVGVFDENIYSDREFFLCPGDRILFYTDGVTESKGSSLQEFGRDRLKKIFKSGTIAGLNGENTLKKLKRELRGFTGTRFFNDDITLLLMERYKE